MPCFKYPLSTCPALPAHALFQAFFQYLAIMSHAITFAEVLSTKFKCSGAGAVNSIQDKAKQYEEYMPMPCIQAYMPMPSIQAYKPMPSNTKHTSQSQAYMPMPSIQAYKPKSSIHVNAKHQAKYQEYMPTSSMQINATLANHNNAKSSLSSHSSK
ncbi:hypothetical protein L3X38_025921 [Prunus dulcis]|uniref:Uncharacterized protein n=1 Tax=Prunus dulcis TaxID=3755 RepID=A0AAD4W4G8_PRUDU|nr:hypothetical protein L3X38_025921 [Prunus dulcis]